jgi:large subunit ribosomal protein L24e
MTLCSFCGHPLERGTGKMYVKSDGSIQFFCARKCEKNSEIRDKKKVPWTAEFRKLKARRMKGAEVESEETKEMKVKQAQAKEAKAPSKK